MWFGFIAEPLFYSLRWLHGYVSNYGWDIVLMTLAINMLLYPLKVKSWRSMQRMQKAAPEIKQIQDRYKKYSMRDPRKQEMNKEVMAVYSREGINPMGSCLPTVIQMPIWFGLYRMLTVTLELRHAPWVGWIHDLAGKDSLLHPAGGDGAAHVRGDEDDAADHHRSLATENDGADAPHVRRHVHSFSGFERPGIIYIDK